MTFCVNTTNVSNIVKHERQKHTGQLYCCAIKKQKLGGNILLLSA